MNLMMLLEMAAGGFGDRVADGQPRRHRHHLPGAVRPRSESPQLPPSAEADAERVALVDISSPALPVALFGSAWAGTPFVPLNYRLTPRPSCKGLAGQVVARRRRRERGHHRRHSATSTGSTVRSSGRSFLDGHRRERDRGCVPDWNMDPDEIAILLYTSGTTGAPKAAVLRHKHLVSYILGSVEFMGADGGRGHAGVGPAVPRGRAWLRSAARCMPGGGSCSSPTSTPTPGSTWRATRA